MKEADLYMHLVFFCFWPFWTFYFLSPLFYYFLGCIAIRSVSVLVFRMAWKWGRVGEPLAWDGASFFRIAFFRPSLCGCRIV